MGRLVEPFCLEGSLVAVLSSGEGILQGDTSGGSDVALGTLVRELLDEGCEVLGLERERETVSLRTSHFSCVCFLYIFFLLFFFHLLGFGGFLGSVVGKHTKLVSAAWLSCCSAAFRSVASNKVKSQFPSRSATKEARSAWLTRRQARLDATRRPLQKGGI